MILKALGFQSSVGDSISDKKTFAVLTGATVNKMKIIRQFNRDDNIEGGRINVIIGSQAVSEGVTLKNVQVEIVQTAWFNYARIDQALARGYRAGSHRALPPNITQNIYLQVAIPNKSYLLKDSFSEKEEKEEKEESLTSSELQGIDVQMYRIAQKKDISFKKIEEVMRSAAFDCALTYERNHIIGTPDTRECNYSNCDYKCVGISGGKSLSDKELDYSTYQLYYSKEIVNSLILKIVRLFRNKFILSLENIETVVGWKNEFEVLTALDIIISNSIPIYNKYGFTSYLQEDNDMYFLVDSLSTIGSSSMAFYTKYPNIKIKQNFDTIKKKYFVDKALPQAVKDLCEAKDEFVPYIKRLPNEYKEMCLENAMKVLVLEERGMKFKDHQSDLAKKIINYFDSDIRKIPERKLIVSSLMRTDGGFLRCLDTKGDSKNPKSLEWHNCSEKEEEDYSTKRLKRRQSLEKKPFYGQINRKEKKFCIRDCRKGGCNVDTPGHLKTAGAQCYNGYNVHTLVMIATFYTEMQVPATKETIDYISTRGCGPPTDKKDFPQLNNIKIRGGKQGIRVGAHKISLKEKDLRKFLLASADDFKNNGKNAHPVFKKWFKPTGDLFQYLDSLGAIKSDDPWKALKAGIKNMTHEQMKRMVWYGTLQKTPICMFLCSWFNQNNILVDDIHCGSGNKPKPKTRKKKS